MGLRLLSVVCILILMVINVLFLPCIEANQARYARWSKTQMPLKVYIEDGSAISGYKQTFTTSVAQALSQWKNSSRGMVNFAIINDKSKADIVFSWASRIRKEETSGQTTGHSYVWGITKMGNPVKVILVTKHPLDDKQSLSDNNIYMIALHETGHALGMWWHTRDPQDIMYPDFMIPSIASNGTRIITNKNKGTLTNRDIQNLAALYNNNDIIVIDKLPYGSSLKLQTYNPSSISEVETTGSAAASVATKSSDVDVNLGDALAYLKKNPNSFEAYNNLGLVYLNNNDYNMAIQSFNKSIALNNKYSKAHFNLALCYSRMKKINLAIYEYEKYLELEPEASNTAQVKKELERLKTLSSNDF